MSDMDDDMYDDDDYDLVSLCRTTVCVCKLRNAECAQIGIELC